MKVTSLKREKPAFLRLIIVDNGACFSLGDVKAAWQHVEHGRHQAAADQAWRVVHARVLGDIRAAIGAAEANA